jgi:glycerate kinase
LKILIAPDKFKDSLTALKVCEALALGIKRIDPSIEIVNQPMADGGEGTLEVLKTNLGLEKVEAIVKDPLFRPIKAYYLKNEHIAFIEMAEASGLKRLETHEYNPAKTSTFGTGELIKHAIESGVKRINLFIGGSATNDGGIGLASALGCSFYSKEGNVLNPTGESLSQIHQIDVNAMKKRIEGIEFKVLTDVTNELYGTDGAAYVYASQKGANAIQMEELDNGLRHLANLLNNRNEKIKGAGAGGGIGYGAISFLGAKVQSGISFMLDITQFERKVKEADLVITGEGRIDHQSFQGKVISGVMQIAKPYNKAVILTCGYSEIELNDVPAYQIIDISDDLNAAKTNATSYLRLIGERIVRDLR